jgi:hypothetical protein
MPTNPSINQVSSMNPQAAPLPIHITYGYSQGPRPDLKQFILDLICSGDGDVPLFLKVADGNQADSAVFGKILSSFKQQLNVIYPTFTYQFCRKDFGYVSGEHHKHPSGFLLHPGQQRAENPVASESPSMPLAMLANALSTSSIKKIISRKIRISL